MSDIPVFALTAENVWPFGGYGWDIQRGLNDRWIMCGQHAGGEALGVRISDDNCVTWTSVVIDPAITNQYLYRLATDGAGTWVVVGDNDGVAAMIWYSLDNGATWARASGVSSLLRLRAVATDGNGNWMAGGDNGHLLSATNPAGPWAEPAGSWLKASGHRFRTIKWAHGRFLLSLRVHLYESANGSSVSEITANLPDHSGDLYDIAGGSMVMVGGTNARLWTTDDGAAWVRRVFPGMHGSSTLERAGYANGQWVIDVGGSYWWTRDFDSTQELAPLPGWAVSRRITGAGTTFALLTGRHVYTAEATLPVMDTLWGDDYNPSTDQKFYRAEIESADHGALSVPVSSWQATLQDGRANFVQAVVPSVLDYVDDILLRAGSDFVIYAGVRFADGDVQEIEVARAQASFRYDRGPTNATGTLSGYRRAPVDTAPKTRVATGVRSLSITADTTRARADIDFFLRPGDTVDLGDRTVLVAWVNFYANAQDQYMDFGDRAL